jgi:hypothetical protein
MVDKALKINLHPRPETGMTDLLYLASLAVKTFNGKK